MNRKGSNRDRLRPTATRSRSRVSAIYFASVSIALFAETATDPAVVAKLMDGDSPARLVLTDEPYNVAIAAM